MNTALVEAVRYPESLFPLVLLLATFAMSAGCEFNVLAPFGSPDGQRILRVIHPLAANLALPSESIHARILAGSAVQRPPSVRVRPKLLVVGQRNVDVTVEFNRSWSVPKWRARAGDTFRLSDSSRSDVRRFLARSSCGGRSSGAPSVRCFTE